MLASDPAKAAAVRMGKRAPAAASASGRTSTAASESTLASAFRSGWTHCAPLAAVATSSCAKEKGHLKALAIAADRDAGRIVAAIFQALEAFQDDGDRFAVPDIANDAAHRFILGAA